ncbi:myelin-oligodendrocyte glycoprotein-like [Sparus aurata]|uniref:myelin-oligodendrocyte glycoprotein-like n=1 Tax=Sparus aurata TaxID=8175 RepID=UPI0011C17814|nr:myelin-oligodendrocyte glycoprotein-like [Sparus aurata]
MIESMFLALLFTCMNPTVLLAAETQLIGSHQPIVALVGDDVLLPCHLEPPLDVTTLSVEWRRGSALVHVYRSRGDDPVSQDQNFKGRTSLFQDEMTRGNISLKLTDITEQDAGNYTCSVPKLQRSSVTLVVEPPPARGFLSTFIVIIAAIAVIVLVVTGTCLKNKKIVERKKCSEDQAVL